MDRTLDYTSEGTDCGSFERGRRNGNGVCNGIVDRGIYYYIAFNHNQHARHEICAPGY